MAEEEKKADEKEEFEPKIVGFLCKWCSSSAADLAGTSRIQYPPNIRIIRLMCSGSVDSVYLVKALMEGADGVLVAGCHPGDCHYIEGNYKARRRVALLKDIMKTLGLDTDRVWIRWIGADEGRKFAETVSEMTKELKKMGSNPMQKHWAL
ncbi:MAG: hydrogenase iron-sulfur subunit [Methanomassiliicoccales archaeon]|nr:MAG: hydrogenase iron-sulfur subunit [Methanomassiliicoccales archaeon]